MTLRARGEAGQMGGIEALPFGVLIFVVGALLVANVWGVIDAKLAVSAAAREAARAYVEAPDAHTAADQAVEAAREAVAGHGRDPNRLELARVGGFHRCGRITYHAAYAVPALVVPWVGGFGAGFTARARHSELVDPYRSGPAGSASC
jgi:hypothetical protein